MISRLSAEIMPSVMVPRSSGPSGLPIAATLSPTLTESSQNSATGSPTALILITATSLALSAPTRLAVNSLSSQSVTVASLEPSSTCALVSI